jgi:serine phosphatase RsbU (regulator of sigma subunit)
MIFYTDGIVETRNPQGEEIGYSGFKQILLDSYDMNPEVFYNNVLQHYQKHLGENEAQDDLTYLIMICDESKI